MTLTFPGSPLFSVFLYGMSWKIKVLWENKNVPFGQFLIGHIQTQNIKLFWATYKINFILDHRDSELLVKDYIKIRNLYAVTLYAVWLTIQV